MRLNLFVLSLILFNSLVIPQQDSTKEKPTQYRRGIELNKNQQSYEEKYADKNLNEEKRSLFPLVDGTGVWTELNPKVPRVTYLGIHFFNPDTGWFVGDLGAVIKTINGGEDWTISETNTTTLLLKVNSFDGQIVIATGYNGFILRSTDGGENFTQVTSGVGSGIDLWGLQMLNDTVGFVCGLNQTLLKTTDTGLTWQPVNTGLNQHYWALDFLDENFGMIACSGGKILSTTDGGNSWIVHQAGDASDLFSIDIIDTLNIAAAGLNGKNVYSSDGGVSWLQNNRLQHDELNSIKFISKDTGYTIGTYGGDSWGIRKTTNRGITWFSPPIQNLSEWELQLLPGGVGYSAGSNLWISKTTGGYDNWDGLFLNANFVDVFFTGELTGYAADGRYTGGPLYKTTDGGLNWFGLPNFPSQVFTSSLRSITFTDSVTGFAGSAPARIIKTTDAGDSWYIVNRTGLTDTIGLINRFFFINPTTGWAVTTRGGILKTTDAGENWFAQLNAGSFVIFQNIYFIDSLNGWTANVVQWPFKTTNGGNTWIQQTNLNIFSLTDIYFSNSDTGYAASSSATNPGLHKTTDGGLSWSLVFGINSPRTFGLFPNKYHWLIHGFGGYVYETQNGGNTFTDISNDVPSVFIRFSAPVNYLGYAVGSLGLVLKYLDTSYVPVELIAFEGTIENNKVILTWQTASELNNRGFEIEKSFDEETWFNIGFVEGRGTATNVNHYSFIDNEITFDIQFYRLKQIDYDGSFEFSHIIEIEAEIPFEYSLLQNYPNPFNPLTKISFNLKMDSKVTLKIFDVLGKEITSLIKKDLVAGYYSIEFNGSGYPSGVYFFRLQSEGINGEIFDTIKKMMLIK